MHAIHASVRGASAAGGQVLRAATDAVAALRPAAKPLHPSGSVTSARLHRLGSPAEAGVPWLDEPGEDEVLVRRSRAVGLPAPAPDIYGLALRVTTTGGRYGDLLLATTGLGRLTRFTLTGSRSPYVRPLTTLLPYRTPAGPVVLAAVFRDRTAVELSWALGAGPWHRFGELRLADDSTAADDAPVSFDPVLNTLPGLENYGWVRRLREPSYATARRSRAAAAGRTG